MHKKLVASLLVLTTLSPIAANAAFNGVSIHSRANCGNNESISWDFLKPHWWNTVSRHFVDGKYRHYTYAGNRNTRRSAAVHWFESSTAGKYTVKGSHFFLSGPDYKLLHKDLTEASDCNIYNGWWDFKNGDKDDAHVPG